MRGLKIHHEVIEWVGSRKYPYLYKSIIIIDIIIIIIIILIIIITDIIILSIKN